MENEQKISDSREIYSNQQGIHENLERIVSKHLRTEFKKPPAEHTVVAFNEVAATIAAKPMPLIIDSCCGTGFSSRKIAEQNPHAWVIGLDRSAKRLGKEEQEHKYSFKKQNFAGDCVFATQQHFVSNLIAGTPFETDVASYIPNILVLEKIYESSAKKMPLKV